MANSIKKNLGFQTIYQILNTCLPLITGPYLARVLGATQLGVFSYTSSVVSYFTLIAILGTVNYGTRSIASVKDDVMLRSKKFCEIYSLQLGTSIIAIILYVIYVAGFDHENTIISVIQIIAIISCACDISWLFFGLESFKTTLTINLIFRIATVLAILVLVKSPKDLWIYALLMLGGTLLAQLFLWIYVPRYIRFLKISCKDIICHLKPNLLLFIPLLAMSVYHTMDKTMLGLLSTYEQTGYYYNSDKVINIPLCIINGVGTVMLPRMTSLYNLGRKEEGNKLFLISLECIAVVSIAMAFGIAAIAKEFVPLFFGNGYDSCVSLVVVLAPVLIIKGLSNTVRTQYLIPLSLETIFTKSVIAGAITNLIFNILLIPKMGAMGAVIGTLLAELVACIWQFICIYKTIDLNRSLCNCFVYLGAGIIMFVCVRVVAIVLIPIWIKITLEIIVGIIVYFIICLAFWKISNSKMYRMILHIFLDKN